jgi:hypothetical protein
MIGAQLAGLRVKANDPRFDQLGYANWALAIHDHDNGWGQPGTPDVGGHESRVPIDAMRQCFEFVCLFLKIDVLRGLPAQQQHVLACMEWNASRLT